MVFNYLYVLYFTLPNQCPIITANNQAIVMAVDTTIADPIIATVSVNALFFMLLLFG